MVLGLPFSALLSQLLVAFTIEFDNEFERLMPHRTTRQAGANHGPWLVSLVMWSNCMKFVGDDGVSVRELEELAGTKTNLKGMERWGYVVIGPDPADASPRPPPSAWVIRATHQGRQAQQVWRPLFDSIESRWQTRFGEKKIHQLRESLSVLVDRMGLDLPECLPILGYGLFSKGLVRRRRPAASRDENMALLSTLLSRTLLAFALEFERESEISLAISANVVRVLDEQGVRVRDLPLLSGVSKEAIRMALGFLEKRRLIVVEREPAGGPNKIARLTPGGQKVQEAYTDLVRIIEERWQSRFGHETIRGLRSQLEGFVGERLLSGLEPYPDGWRASVRKSGPLPHFPMVLHRGGFPDGS